MASITGEVRVVFTEGIGVTHYRGRVGDVIVGKVESHFSNWDVTVSFDSTGGPP